jgi:hypothetical protein
LDVFTAKVIADGRFFMGQMEKDTLRDAHQIEAGKKYYGLVFDHIMGDTQYIEYSECEPATFDASELEDLPGEFRLLAIRGKRPENLPVKPFPKE